MTELEDINLGKIDFDENHQERKSWSCLGQTCSRSLIVFLSQLFVILLIIFGCFCRIHISQNLWRINCLGWNFVQCGRIHFTRTKIMNKLFSTKVESLFYWLDCPKLKNRSLFTVGEKLEHLNKSLTKFSFLINIPNLSTMLCWRKLKISSLCKEQTLNILIR